MSDAAWSFPAVDSKVRANYVMLFTLPESRRAPDSAFSRARGSTQQIHPFSLDSEALRHLQCWGKTGEYLKRPAPKEMARMKEALYLDLASGSIDIRRATVRMRKILGMNQKEYARKVAGISPRILAEFENGSGNPTLATLVKIAQPFGLKVTFLPPKAWRVDTRNEQGDL